MAFNARHCTTRGLLLGTLALLAALAVSSAAVASHDRPGGATPFRVPLVPAYNQCTASNTTHVSGYGACTPPSRQSPFGRTGTTGAGQGFVKLEVICTDASVPPCPAAGDQADVKVTMSQTDVLCAFPGPAANCPGGNGGDYVGPGLLDIPFRLTDHSGGGTLCTVASGSGCTTATVQNLSLNIPFSCSQNGTSAPPGSNCNVTTSLDAITVPDIVSELQRQVWDSIASLALQDPGLDLNVGSPGICPPNCRTGDESTFARPGWFVP